MSRRIPLRRNEQGAAALEFAIAVPVLISFIYGIAQIGMLFEASAGMQHGLGEGARYATLCVNMTSTACGVPTDTQISTKVTSSVYGTTRGTLDQLAITAGPGGVGGTYKDLSLTYHQPTDFLFFAGPTASITRTKRVFLAES
jgi:Flp pilus assembly protein TadG